MSALRAYRIFNEDGKVVSRFVDLRLEELDPGEVVVKVAYSSVNYKDALAATGAGRIIRRFPCVGGIDLSGTVVESSSPGFKKGDAVIATSYDLGVAHDGGYAEYCRVPSAWVVAMPRGLDLFEAMALGTAGFTAGLAVDRMEHDGLKPANGPVIVTGATGGVGSIAVDVLAGAGYQVVPPTCMVLAIQDSTSPPRLSTAPAHVALSNGLILVRSRLLRSMISLAPSFFR